MIRILSLALDSIDLLCRQTGGLGVRDLSRQLGIGKSTGHRILQTLEEHGLARQDPKTARYVITARLIEMASLIQSKLEFRSLAHPFLCDLQKRCGETVFMGVMDASEVVIVDRIDSTESLRMTQEVGFREPAHSTALGKVLLASTSEADVAAIFKNAQPMDFTGRTLNSIELLHPELERVRNLGFALDDEETLTGVRCVAAPIRNALGSVLAAISISGPSVRLTTERLPRLAEEVQGTAEIISRHLGFMGGVSTLKGAEKLPVRPGRSNRFASLPSKTIASTTSRKRRTRRGVPDAETSQTSRRTG
jgi:DNA-binding IclR family transcriptional regulator